MIIIDNVLSYRNADGSFRHTRDGGGNDQMATEQALYGLVAAVRAIDGKNSLYRMGDAVQRGEFLPIEQETPTGAGLPGKSPNVSAMPVTIPGRTFPEIQNHANKAAIEALAERGIINGKTVTPNDGTPAVVFDPDATMTRAEFAAIVTRGLGLGLVHNTQIITHNFFEDVIADDWFFEAVSLAAYYEIVKGISDTSFNPGGTITRQETAVMAARAAKLCGMDTEMGEAAIRDTLAPFGDYRSVASWAQGAVAFCYDAGILDDTEFDIGPGVAIRRCEIAEMLYRMLSSANLI